MSPTPLSPRPPTVIRPALVAAALLSLRLLVPAQDPDPQPPVTTNTPKTEVFCVLPESYDMRPEVFVLVPGARRVGYSLFRETSAGLEPYKRDELRTQRLSWIECFLRGQEAATRHLKTLEPKIFRDEATKIIQYAHFFSENQLTASIFISPEFPKLFETTLGKELYVAIPDRFNVFVFPKFSDSIQQLSPKMAYLYKEALYPVSREVFQLSKAGIRVIGKF